MPPTAKGPRLYLRAPRKDRQAMWAIRDGTKEVGTGCSQENREQAERALADYINRKYREPSGPSDPHQMSIGRTLEIYGNEHAPHVASPATIGFHIDAMAEFWGDLPVSAVRGATCRAYVKQREKEGVKAATARRELQTLSAAINYCHKEGYLTLAPRVTLPKKAEPRQRWLTRSEAARLLLAAWRMRAHAPHLWVFILIGLYTGTRGGAILRLQWLPNLQGGWIDLERGVLYRGAEQRVETNKKQTPCTLPTKLLGLLRLARRQTVRHVIEYGGRGKARHGRKAPLSRRVMKLRRSWRSACKEAGLGVDVTPHTLRHTAVTWRLQRGVPIWEVAGYVGASEKMIRDTYGHHCPDHQKAARDAI